MKQDNFKHSLIRMPDFASLITFTRTDWTPTRNYFSSVFVFLLKVSLIVFLHYCLYVDMPLPLSPFVALGKNHKQINLSYLVQY